MPSRILYLRSPQWAGLLARPDELVAGDGFREVKNIARNRAGFLTSPQGTVFIKRFASGSWIEGILERIRGSRAARSIRGADMLGKAGFLVPAPLAASEEVSAGAVRTSWIISEALEAARVFSRYIERGHAPIEQERRLRRETLAQVAAAVRRMHDAGLFTSDLQETNLMLDQEGGALRIYFVDLDGFRRLPSVSWKRRRRNLVQLDRSVGRFMSRSERLRFLRTYLGGGWNGQAARKLVEHLLRERERKEREFTRKHLRRSGKGRLDSAGTQPHEAAAPEFSQTGRT
jgi:tRNA A-37 threonylcarbamoyl transferase component Bud32